MAALWVTSLVVILGGASVLLDAWGSRDRTNPIPFWCHLSLGPVILMAFVSVPGLAGRMHRSSRVEKLVGIFSLVGVLLTLLCWTSPFLGILQVGP